MAQSGPSRVSTLAAGIARFLTNTFESATKGPLARPVLYAARRRDMRHGSFGLVLLVLVLGAGCTDSGEEEADSASGGDAGATSGTGAAPAAGADAGGAPGTGGSPAAGASTGGAATAGAATAGAATGGVATGGEGVAGMATGGAATGGLPATGGASTGGLSTSAGGSVGMGGSIDSGTGDPGSGVGATGSASGGAASMGGAATAGGAAGAAGAGDTAGAAGAPWPTEPIEIPPPPPLDPGQLTAGVWDDNANFDFFERYQASALDGQGTPLTGALPIDAQAQLDAEAAAAAERTPRSLLDVALVVDTTGSMSDELEYLKVEFSALHASILARYPNAEQRWALLLYRDEGDEYVTRSFEFTTSADSFQANLALQSANGGGDMPEAAATALAAAAGLSWRSGADVARMLLWVADAPHHAERAAQMVDAVMAVKGVGAHVYPVASSGIDTLAELSMRQTAQLTFGRYLFLTDDSGIGGAHAEPTIPCHYVRLLNDTVLRVVDAEMTGTEPAPALEQVLRIGGDIDQDGYCIYGTEPLYRPF